MAESVQRAPLHPPDQFRAFLAMREKGRSEEEIAAAFFVSVAVVRQRLRLASVSSKLLAVYAEDGLTLDQLMAFAVTGDHQRQEQVAQFEAALRAFEDRPLLSSQKTSPSPPPSSTWQRWTAANRARVRAERG